MRGLNGLDLFSGIAGNTLGLREYVKTIAYCEADRHAQSVLISRMADGEIERAPIWDDIRTLHKGLFDLDIDIIIGGFPCQDISIAGAGKGLAGERSGLFYEVCRLVEEIKPTFVFLENVPAIRTRGLREVVREFTNLGYDCRWARVSAAEVGASHLRQRWFLLAYSKSNDGRRELRGLLKKDESKPKPKEQCEDPSGEPSYASSNPSVLAKSFRGSNHYWEVEPDVGRVANGVPLRVDRIKRLGNAVVPIQAKEAFERLIGLW